MDSMSHFSSRAFTLIGYSKKKRPNLPSVISNMVAFVIDGYQTIMHRRQRHFFLHHFLPIGIECQCTCDVLYVFRCHEVVLFLLNRSQICSRFYVRWGRFCVRRIGRSIQLELRCFGILICIMNYYQSFRTNHDMHIYIITHLLNSAIVRDVKSHTWIISTEKPATTIETNKSSR